MRTGEGRPPCESRSEIAIVRVIGATKARWRTCRADRGCGSGYPRRPRFRSLIEMDPMPPKPRTRQRSQRLARRSAGADPVTDRRDASRGRPDRAALERAEQLAQTGTWEWDLDTDVLLWSDNMFRLLGVEPGSVAPTPEYVIGRVHPDDRDRVEREVELAREGWEPARPCLSNDLARRHAPRPALLSGCGGRARGSSAPYSSVPSRT